MLALFLISGSVIAIALYRSIATLLRQIPNRNLDFDAFFPDSATDHLSAANARAIPDAIRSNEN